MKTHEASPRGPTISLGELEVKRRVMTPGEWTLSNDAPNSVTIYGQHDARFDDPRDAAGVIAEHAAIPTLLGIAKAALAYQRAVASERRGDQLSALTALEAAVRRVRP